MTSDDVVPRILAAIEVREASAKSWSEDDLNALAWRVAGARQLTYQNNGSDVVMAIDCQANEALSWEAIYVRHDTDGRRAAFIVENNPASALRRCAVDRHTVRTCLRLIKDTMELSTHVAAKSILRGLADSYGVAPAEETADE